MDKQREYFDSLYDAHWLSLRKFIFVQARRDAGWTDEIFQNTWMSAWKGLSALKEPASARAWLFAIAKNEARRFFAGRGFRPFSDGEGAPDGEAEAADEAAGTFPEALADADLLARLIAGLSEAEQQLVLLRYAYDMSLVDIAKQYGANYSTVKSQMKRALEKLRRAAEPALP
ncbi:MAG: RNA polymerase sigma factor [Clostridiales Family XIII bacterium]|jgi:RNA polymerase sigma-70 factor (ECF subfamily)|nr:RNA polymerase sigma factor [Clostridiales Family XIII bacterium]